MTTNNSIDHSANTYQWTRAQGAAAPANINGATNQTYVVVAGDVGYTLGVNVGNTATVGTVSSGRTQTVQEARADRGPQTVPGLTDGMSATVRGVNLTAAEWSQVPGALATAINAARAADPDKGAFVWVFEANTDNAIIIVRQTLDNGNKYEVKDGQWNILYINYAYLVGNAADKSATLIEAVIKMASWEAGYAKAAPSRDKSVIAGAGEPPMKKGKYNVDYRKMILAARGA